MLADTQAFSRALDAMGLLGTHVAVVGASSYEWVVTYFGTVNSGGVIVPIDKELGGDDIAELLNRADVEAVVYDTLLYDRIERIRELCPNIRFFIDSTLELDGENALSFENSLKQTEEALTRRLTEKNVRHSIYLGYYRQEQGRNAHS